MKWSLRKRSQLSLASPQCLGTMHSTVKGKCWPLSIQKASDRVGRSGFLLLSGGINWTFKKEAFISGRLGLYSGCLSDIESWSWRPSMLDSPRPIAYLGVIASLDSKPLFGLCPHIPPPQSDLLLWLIRALSSCSEMNTARVEMPFACSFLEFKASFLKNWAFCLPSGDSFPLYRHSCSAAVRVSTMVSTVAGRPDAPLAHCGFH